MAVHPAWMEKELIYKRLGERVGRLRKAAGLTQNQLAERISRSVDAVSNIERGSSAPPPETALSIAQALGVELTDIYDLDLTGKPVPQDIKDFLLELREILSTFPSDRREEIYSIIRKVNALSDRK